MVQLHGSLLLINLFCLSTTENSSNKVIINQFLKAGSRSALKKQLDLVTHREKQQDPNPSKINADPQPWALVQTVVPSELTQPEDEDLLELVEHDLLYVVPDYGGRDPAHNVQPLAQVPVQVVHRTPHLATTVLSHIGWGL